MRRALALARRGLGLASPNPMVGCVIVLQGGIVGSGWHEYSRVEHAEVRALRAAGDEARGATVYLTLEPCCHEGRTPPCAPRLIAAGVQRVVIASMDPNPKVCGKGIELLRSAGLQVEVGLMADEANELIEPFACHITTGRPLVVAKAGMSLDAKIGIFGSEDRVITSPEAQDFSQYLRQQMDAILVGSGTVLADDPELSYRGTQPRSRPLIRVILDSRLRTPPSARLFQVQPCSPLLIFCKPDAPEARRIQLQEQGAEIICAPQTTGGIDLGFVLDHLGKRQVLGLLVEGGSAVHWSFLSEGMTDKFYLIMAPMILGGHNSIPAIGGLGYENISEAPRLMVRRRFSVGPDFVTEAYPGFSRSILFPRLPEE
jgi:diaminohydroxyphosphoribosylaminopyrimidine deaminase / 5-amino-6-(5-phosphoribosylamino)uracil reductase